MPSQGGMCPTRPGAEQNSLDRHPTAPKDLSSGQPWRQKKGLNDLSGPSLKILRILCPSTQTSALYEPNWNRRSGQERGRLHQYVLQEHLGEVSATTRAPLHDPHWRVAIRVLKNCFLLGLPIKSNSHGVTCKAFNRYHFSYQVLSQQENPFNYELLGMGSI